MAHKWLTYCLNARAVLVAVLGCILVSLSLFRLYIQVVTSSSSHSGAITHVMARVISQLTFAIVGALLAISHSSPDGHNHHYALSGCRFYVRSNGWTWCAADSSKSRGGPWVLGISRLHEKLWSPGVSIKPTGVSQLPGLHRFRGGPSSSPKDSKPKKELSCYKPFASEGIFLNDRKGT